VFCAELNVSKSALIAWVKDLQKAISNSRTVRMNEQFERFTVAKAKPIELFGKRLETIPTELDKRDLSEVKTRSAAVPGAEIWEMFRTEHEPLT
jgi:hypothetical protein